MAGRTGRGFDALGDLNGPRIYGQVKLKGSTPFSLAQSPNATRNRERQFAPVLAESSIARMSAHRFSYTQRKRAPRISSMDQLLTEAEVADYLRISLATIRRWRAEGTGPPWLRVGRGIRYSRRSLDAWVERQEAERDQDS